MSSVLLLRNHTNIVQTDLLAMAVISRPDDVVGDH